MPTHRSSHRRPSPARRSPGLWPLLLAMAVLLFAAGYCFGARDSESEPGGAAESYQEPAASSSLIDPSKEAASAPAQAVTSQDVASQTVAVQEPEAGSEVEPMGSEPGDSEASTSSAASLPAGGGARVALVIDDLGRSLAEVRALRKLGVPITYAVLPFESRTPQVVERLRQAGEEIICHLPMEPRNGANPGPGALRTSMDATEVRALTRRALEAVEGAVGVNNHMGSSLTADPRLMAAILEEIDDRRLFFLDSRTSSESVGYRLASEMGIATAERQVFLDPDPADEAVRYQFRRLLDLARRGGAAIAIGHPYASTLSVLAEEVPKARAQGYDFVPVSFLLDRTGDLPER